MPWGGMKEIYLEHHVTTQVLPEVVEAMAPWWSERPGSVSGIHSGSVRAGEALEAARESLAALVGMPGEVVFTGSGTEAINLAVLGHARAQRRFGRHVVATVIEHPAVLASLAVLEQEGFECGIVPVDDRGRVDREVLAEALREDTLLVCCQLGNLDVGTVQEVGPLGAMLRERGIALFVDGTTSLGWTGATVGEADMVALAPHRFGGPPGVGCLWRRRSMGLEPLIRGGNQEGGLRAGTENVPAIVGSGVAARAVLRDLGEHCRRMRGLQRMLLKELSDRIPGLRLNGAGIGEERLSHHLSLTIGGVEAEGLVLFADLRGLRIGAGSGCLSRSMEPDHVLAAIGLGAVPARETVTLACGRETTGREIREAAEILRSGVERMRSLSPSRD